MNQHEYVAGVLQYYRENDIIPGDPNEGRWEEAHYPLPRSMGDEVILLKPEHHFVQGLLQSEEVGRCCFWIGRTKKFLQSEFVERLPEDFLLLLTQLYDKWTAAHLASIQSKGGKIAGKIAGRKNVESGHLASISSKGGKIGGKIAGKIAVESGHLASIRSKGGKIGGKIVGRKNVESGHLDKIRS